MMRHNSFRSVFVLGTDTEVGKTFQAVLLVRELTEQGQRVGVYKPVASGIAADCPSDSDLLLNASAVAWPIERVCPQSFQAPLAPPVAARLEGKQVDEALLMRGLHWWRDRCDMLVVEAAGGVLSPISASMTNLDLVEESGLQTILVTANRLGVVNQVLLSVAALQSRNIKPLGIVLNQLPPATACDDPSLGTNRELLASFVAGIPIVDSIVELAESV